jgi:hypothetical protein
MTEEDIDWFRSKVRLQLESFDRLVLNGASIERVERSFGILNRTRKQLFLAIDVYLTENMIDNGTNND